MIKELTCKLVGTIGFFNKAEGIALIGRVSNKQTDKINEMIKVINQLETKVKKLEGEVNKHED